MQNKQWYRFILPFLCLLVVIPVGAAEGIDGYWVGVLKVPGAELKLSLTLTSADDGSYTGTLNSMDQGSGEMPLDTVIFENDHLLVKLQKLALEIEGDVDFKALEINGEFRQGAGKFPITFAQVEEKPALVRPQYPQKPYPYHEQEVTYENQKAGITIAGTLTFPKEGGPFPAVILLTGSGQQNRDEEVFGHKPFMVLADYLTRQGIAVLRADDRGIGGTTGPFQGSTTADFADDALAGVEYLKSRQEIDAKKIGLIGHSEGGMIAPLAAAASDDISFIVLMAGVGIRFDDIILYQYERQWQKAGLDEARTTALRNWHNKMTEITLKDIDNAAVAAEIRNVYAGLSEQEKSLLNFTPEDLENSIKWMVGPWHRYASKYGPVAVLSKVKCPVLAMNGSKDTQVSAKENLAGIKKGLIAGGNQKYAVVEMAGPNHLFQTAETGDGSEYVKIEETMSPTALQLIGDWVKARVK